MGIRRRYCEICGVSTRQQDVPTKFGATGLFGRGSNCDQCGHLNQSRIQYWSVVVDRTWRLSAAAVLMIFGATVVIMFSLFIQVIARQ